MKDLTWTARPIVEGELVDWSSLLRFDLQRDRNKDRWLESVRVPWSAVAAVLFSLPAGIYFHQRRTSKNFSKRIAFECTFLPLSTGRAASCHGADVID